MNNISLTVRLPHELNSKLAAVSKELGMTKTNLIRSAVHDFLTTDDVSLDFSSHQSGRTDRIVLNVNQLTHSILENTCKTYNQSMNTIVIAVSVLALERAAKWLQSTTK